MVLNKIINSFHFFFGSLLKDCFFSNSFGQLLSEEIVGNDKLQKNVLYIGLKDIETNGISYWLSNKCLF